jgi:hypothetical protein
MATGDPTPTMNWLDMLPRTTAQCPNPFGLTLTFCSYCTERTCSARDSRRKICRAGTPSTRTASGSSPASITAAPSARRRSFRSRAWPPPGMPGPGTLPITPCPPTCSGSWTSCATTAKSRAAAGSGTFWGSSVPSATRSTLWWSKLLAPAPIRHPSRTPMPVAPPEQAHHSPTDGRRCLPFRPVRNCAFAFFFRFI